MLLLEQAQMAVQNGDLPRSDELIGRVLAAEETSSDRSNHDTRMDLWRVLISFVMVLGRLFRTVIGCGQSNCLRHVGNRLIATGEP